MNEIADHLRNSKLARSRRTRRFSSPWTGSRGRSICCSRWRATRRSISRKFRCCSLPTSISNSSNSAERINLELAADYLVMAAWLAFSSRVWCCPSRRAPMASPTRRRNGGAAALAPAAARCDARGRGPAYGARTAGPRRLRARQPGAGQRHQAAHLQGHAFRPAHRLCDRAGAQAGRAAYKPLMRPVLPIEEARERLERMLGKLRDWSALSRLLPLDWSVGMRRRSALASTLLACLELARDGTDRDSAACARSRKFM